ncbi:hypothetical protein D3C78_1163030 [compost metagenome]
MTRNVIHHTRLGGYPRSVALLLVVGVASIVLALAFKALAAFTQYHLSFMLSVVPDALGVRSVSYRKEESWGLGPGGNEAGVRVYPLEEQIAGQVREGGLAFLFNMPPNKNQKNRRWRGEYSEWRETPIKLSAHWRPNIRSGKFEVYDYVCRYGFCVEIDGDIVEEIGLIVNSSGSYYAYGRVGLIIVSPEWKKVIYLYNG